jgi:hypothetical protein
LHEVFRADLLVELGAALIHEHVEQPQGEEHNFGLICLKSLSYLVSRRLAAKASGLLMTCTYTSALALISSLIVLLVAMSGYLRSLLVALSTRSAIY